MAQTTAPADTTRAPAATAPAQTTVTTPAQMGAPAPLFEMKPGQWRATRLTGLTVYDPRNERIGDVNELIIGRDGRVAAIVVGIGGFLGIGEHNAAIPFEQVQWVEEARDRAVAGTAGAPVGTSAPATAPADRAAMDRPATAPPAATAPAGAPATTTAPAGTTAADRPAGTATPAGRVAERAAYRGHPDHAVVNMTREQLRALPEVRYAR
jgi:sporulation protein YlmC with PRC-barrel domain